VEKIIKILKFASYGLILGLVFFSTNALAFTVVPTSGTQITSLACSGADTDIWNFYVPNGAYNISGDCTNTQVADINLVLGTVSGTSHFLEWTTEVNNFCGGVDYTTDRQCALDNGGIVSELAFSNNSPSVSATIANAGGTAASNIGEILAVGFVKILFLPSGLISISFLIWYGGKVIWHGMNVESNNTMNRARHTSANFRKTMRRLS